MRMCYRYGMRKQLENGNRQQLLSVVNGFTDQSEFDVRKMLSGHGA